jgi:hypothetical protein
MKLNNDINYIVSGLERSGTSMLMQILEAGGLSLAFDEDTRPPDENNPKGYFELEGGKIINKLMQGVFPLDEYKGRFVKITAFGLKFLPPGNYKIIYSHRNIEEILDSMEKMAKIQDKDRDSTRNAFVKLDKMIRNLISEREDCDVLFFDYNQALKDPGKSVAEINEFLDAEELDTGKMTAVVDKKLYRNRKLGKEDQDG